MKRKTIKLEELQRLAFCNSKNLPPVVDDDGRRKAWVGFGWIDGGKATGKEVKVIK